MNLFGIVLTPSDAAIILSGFGVLVTFLVAWLPTLKVSDYVKFSIAAGLSIIGGFLTVVATNQFITTGTLIQNAAVVFSASQIFYYGAFRVLGLERVLFPQQALATQVKEQAKESTPDVSTAAAKDILDPTTQPSVQVTAKVVNN
jgi:hypothetical protein